MSNLKVFREKSIFSISSWLVQLETEFHFFLVFLFQYLLFLYSFLIKEESTEI